MAGDYPQPQRVVGHDLQLPLRSPRVPGVQVHGVTGHEDGDDVVLAVLDHAVVIVHHPGDHSGPGAAPARLHSLEKEE